MSKVYVILAVHPSGKSSGPREVDKIAGVALTLEDARELCLQAASKTLRAFVIETETGSLDTDYSEFSESLVLTLNKDGIDPNTL